MAGLTPSPKSPKSHIPGKFGPEIPAPSIETGEIGEEPRGSEFGGALPLEPMRVHPFGGGVAFVARDCWDVGRELQGLKGKT